MSGNDPRSLTPPPSLVTPPLPSTTPSVAPPPHLFTPPLSSIPNPFPPSSLSLDPSAVSPRSTTPPPPALVPPSTAPPSTSLTPSVAPVPTPTPTPAHAPAPSPSSSSSSLSTTPPSSLANPALSPSNSSSSLQPKRRVSSELDALLLHAEAELGPRFRALSVSVTHSGDDGQPSPIPLPPPLPHFPKLAPASPKLQRSHSPIESQDGSTLTHVNSISEIHFTALKRDIKKSGGKSLFHRLKKKDKGEKGEKGEKEKDKDKEKEKEKGDKDSSNPSSPALESTSSPGFYKKLKDRQSVKPTNQYTIPLRISCMATDANDSTATLVWEITVQVGPKTKVTELWERIRESGKTESPDTHALCKDDEVLSEKEYVNKYKVKQQDQLKIKPRTKKIVKSNLNHLIARRPSRDELKHIIATKAPEASVDSVPDVETIQRCVDFLLETEAYKQEGLFRISAGAMNLKLFYDTFRKHEPDFTIIDTPHTVAASLKQGLAAGLIPLRVAIPMREAYQKHGDTPTLYAELAELAKQLPKPNLHVINSVFRLVLEVIKNQETSKMDDRNCSIVFAPNVFAFDTNMDLMQQSELQTKIVHIFFLHYEEIFGPATSILSPTPSL